MLRKYLLMIAGLVLIAYLPLAADWEPADGHKMHFPQLPDETGWAVSATQPLILADDWQCSETGFVKDFHFWGAWKGDNIGQIVQLFVSIHADIPADQSPTGYSMPGATLWEEDILPFTTVRPIDPPTMEGWYNPATFETIFEDHQSYFQYNVFLPEELWFEQIEGTVYWMNVTAIVADPSATEWGWKSTQDHWNDDAVWAYWGELNWIDMYEPEMPPVTNDYFITIGPANQFIGGGGTGFYGNGWYYYPDTDWWNIWFYDHPFTYERFKEIHIEFDVFPIGEPNFFEFAVNWSTDEWSLNGNPPPDPRVPPLPGVDENLFIGWHTFHAGPVEPGHHIYDFTIPDYNPEWVSIDVRGENFEIPNGFIVHACIGEPQSLDLSFVITGGPGEEDTCDFYKSPYPDYSPQGMPDFDQKQLNWVDLNQHWSHDGPAALANCLWWFDSKFEPNPVDPRPFATTPPNDNYPLVSAYGPWDDHDPANVQPLINDLANNFLNTNPGGFGGTRPQDMQPGFRNWLNVMGLSGDYSDSFYVAPTYEFILEQALISQDVVLYLSFYEEQVTGQWTYVGSHWVTTAGVCAQTPQRQICISDPFLDALEGEPPAGAAHGGTVHNDADNISGPHGQIQHDPYLCTPILPPGFMMPVEEVNYPAPALMGYFQGMNAQVDWTPYGGGPLHTIIELAYVICPAQCDCIPGDADGNGHIAITDAVYIINYIFGGGPSPTPYQLCSGDADCNCVVSISDAVYIINYIFGGGAAPCDCQTWLGNCGPPLR